MLLTCNDSQSAGRDALACQCDIIFHFLVFVLGIRVIMRAEVRQLVFLDGVWPFQNLDCGLRRFFWGYTVFQSRKMWGLSQGLLAGASLPLDKLVHNTVRHAIRTRALRHEENT